MKKLIKLIANTFAGIIFLSVFILGFFAYFSRSQEGAIIYDGLGRELYLVPPLLRFIIPDSLWPGFGWYAVDFIVFFGGIAIAGGIIALVNKEDWFDKHMNY